MLFALVISFDCFAQDEMALKRKVAIGRFSNETQYAKSVFYDKNNDPMGKQASDILSTRLAASEKFLLIERQDYDKIVEELNTSGGVSQNIGADYLIIGSITEYGRKTIGTQKMFSNSKEQIVEAAVSLRLVDVSTGIIIYSGEAKGEATAEDRRVMGLGKTADFDATLSDKAISAAISKLVENIINSCMDKPWKAYILTVEDGSFIISGGQSQGIKEGDTFAVMQRGKTVKNPQTGLNIELPGKIVASIKVDMTMGATPQDEVSVASLTEGEIDTAKLDQYYIVEKK
ncbi:Curli production assembly/transport component CsgG [Mangrovibacterium marinum]|uniref:Curli production assembly/transport component CsgG n=2 Tax=Mangrovibacterium marinum TaxID=1639118 RepID=A0A2T5C203_9BACT|nr:Curli production assembly/transport component CsgG [Mangrovibacterium marinum]